MKAQIGPPELAAKLRKIARDKSAPPGARADALALLVGDVESANPGPVAAEAALEVIQRIGRKVRSFATATKRFLLHENPPRKAKSFASWEPPVLPGAPELRLVRVSEGKPGLFPVNGPDKVAVAFADIVQLRNEEVWIGLCNSQLRMFARYRHTIGASAESAVYPSEILRVALYAGATDFFMVHNHPSGDPTPSGADVDITRRLKECCTILGGIRIRDSVVLAADIPGTIPESRIFANTTFVSVGYFSSLSGVPRENVKLDENGSPGINVRYASVMDIARMVG